MEFDLAQTDALLSTTRAVRKRLDLERDVPSEVILECLRLAIQAPTGSNAQGWRWMVVTDPDKRAALADIYRRGAGDYFSQRNDSIDPNSQTGRVVSSATYLAENLQHVPVHVIPMIIGKPDGTNVQGAGLYGSIIPAMWSFQLALRSRGLGSCYTTLHLNLEHEAAELLGIPPHLSQAGLIPVAYTKGTDFKPATRGPVEEITYLNSYKQRMA
jgi:nitroreductase